MRDARGDEQEDGGAEHGCEHGGLGEWRDEVSSPVIGSQRKNLIRQSRTAPSGVATSSSERRSEATPHAACTPAAASIATAPTA